jgi:1,4-dihydroxy-2-naphthoyl-CoA synthase
MLPRMLSRASTNYSNQLVGPMTAPWWQRRACSTSSPLQAYEYLLTKVEGRVGLITLNRPRALNALCSPLMAELGQVLREYEANPDIGAVVLTGSEKAFAGGFSLPVRGVAGRILSRTGAIC